MQNPQEIFNQIQVMKKKQKDLKLAIKDALNASAEYKNLLDKIKELKDKKKQIENSVKQDFTSELQKLDDLAIDIESTNTLLSDVVLTKMMKGETVEVMDEYNNTYEPNLITKFVKS